MKGDRLRNICLVLIVILLLVIVCQPFFGRVMQYRTLEITPMFMSDQLTNLGKEGWELVAWNGGTMVFKK